MSTPKKPGRPPGKKAPERPSISYRLEVDELAALEVFAKENDRTIAAESARAVRKYLRDVGALPDKK